MSELKPLRGQGKRGTVFSGWVRSLSGPAVVFAAPVQFSLAGVEWARPERAQIEVRARSVGGTWSRWVSASVLGHDADGGEGAKAAQYGEPIWFGPCDAVALRSAAPVEGVSVHFVATAAPGGRAAETAARSVAGAAGALPLATPRLDAGPGQPPIIARSAWAGDDNGPAYPPTYGDVRMAFVHHTDNPNGYAAQDVPAMLLAIYDYHRYVRGWFDIGYNFVIDLYGRMWEARAGGIDQAVVGAQAGGYNLESTGVAMLGTFSDVVPTQTAMNALEHLLAWKLALHGVPVLGKVTVEVNPADAFYTPFAPGAHVSLPRVAGHRDGCTTDCPGNALYAQLPSVRPIVNRLAGTAVALSLNVKGQRNWPAAYLSPAGAQIVAGEPLSLSGRLAALDGPGQGGESIELQSVRGDGAEAVLGEAMTGSDGSWSTTLSPAANLLLRALHAIAPAAASPLVAVAVAPALTLQVVSEAPLRVGGTVTPAKARVAIDVYDARGHHKLEHAATVTGSDGRFEARLNLRSGHYWVRAHTAADGQNIAGESPRLTLTV